MKTKLIKDIERIKKRLVKTGICENFGRKDVRKLYEKYDPYLYDNDKDIERLLRDFDMWCMDYTGE
jgi:hypothetical protein